MKKQVKQQEETKQEEQNAQLPIVGPSIVKSVGSKIDVWEGRAVKTAGKLTKDDLFYCEKSKTVKSKKMSELAKARGPVKRKQKA